MDTRTLSGNKGPVIIYEEGGPMLFSMRKEWGLLCFSGTKIRGSHMIQQDL